LARDSAPDAWFARADLEALPLRSAIIAAAWARASYLHVPRARLPLALAELHRAMAPGAPAVITMMRGEGEGPIPDDDFPGRFFARWTRTALADVLAGAGFTVDTLDGDDDDEHGWLHASVTRGRTLADTVGAEMHMLVCGLNPSLHAADAGVPFARPGNRFWPAAIAAGIVSRDRDPRHALRVHHVGMTDIVKRATVGAAEITAAEYSAGTARLERLVRWLQPPVVCFVGLAGWRAAVNRKAVAGQQRDGLGGAAVYVMPSTSGLNARVSIGALAEHLRAAAALAG
jgi:TDG/mug DNA glycosylase family protein